MGANQYTAMPTNEIGVRFISLLVEGLNINGPMSGAYPALNVGGQKLPKRNTS